VGHASLTCGTEKNCPVKRNSKAVVVSEDGDDSEIWLSDADVDSHFAISTGLH